MVKGKALQLGALDCHVVDAREEFAARVRAAGDQGERALRRRLPAVHRARPAADRQAGRRVRAQDRLRHDRPRLHRQGQRPGADRVDRDRARPGDEDHRPGARLADGPRGGDRLRARARHPGQGRHRGAAVLDRRQPLGPLLGGRADRGPRRAAARRRLPARHPARATRPTSPRTWRSSSSAACPWRSTASGSGLVELLERAGEIGAPPRRGDRRPHRGPDRRPQGARPLRGAGRGDHPARPQGAREARRARSTRTTSSPGSTSSGPSSSTPGSGTSRCSRDLERLHGLGQRAGHRRDHHAALQGQRARRWRAARRTRSTTRRWPASASRAACSRSRRAPGFIELWRLQSRMAYNVRNREREKE